MARAQYGAGVEVWVVGRRWGWEGRRRRDLQRGEAVAAFSQLLALGRERREQGQLGRERRELRAQQHVRHQRHQLVRRDRRRAARARVRLDEPARVQQATQQATKQPIKQQAGRESRRQRDLIQLDPT